MHYHPKIGRHAFKGFDFINRERNVVER